MRSNAYAERLVLHLPRPDHPPVDLSQERIQRRPVLGGLLSEYERFTQKSLCRVPRRRTGVKMAAGTARDAVVFLAG